MSPIPHWFERTSRKFDHASQMEPEVNRVEASGARIIRVSQQRIEYVNMKGQEQFIDLEECAKNWVRWCGDNNEEFVPVPGASQADIDAERARCVGLRGGTDPVWWAKFMNERKTRFEFASWEARWRELQGPLMTAGWCTFDTE
jgi:hypothetical protein